MQTRVFCRHFWYVDADVAIDVSAEQRVRSQRHLLVRGFPKERTHGSCPPDVSGKSDKIRLTIPKCKWCCACELFHANAEEPADVGTSEFNATRVDFVNLEIGRCES
jgi:hypothetical protein